MTKSDAQFSGLVLFLLMIPVIGCGLGYLFVVALEVKPLDIGLGLLTFAAGLWMSGLRPDIPIAPGGLTTTLIVCGAFVTLTSWSAGDRLNFPADRAPLRLDGCMLDASDAVDMFDGSEKTLINLSRVASVKWNEGFTFGGNVVLDGKLLTFRPSEIPILRQAFERCAGGQP